MRCAVRGWGPGVGGGRRRAAEGGGGRGRAAEGGGGRRRRAKEGGGGASRCAPCGAVVGTCAPCGAVVGTVRALRLWRRLTDELGLVMAIAEKRSLGSWTLWIGVLLIPALGIVVVPRSKLLRAARAIDALLASGLEFHEYRSRCGLLEHLRAVNLRGRNVMHGLYEPHGPAGASRHGPNGLVRCSGLMRKQLQRWLNQVARSARVSDNATHATHVRTRTSKLSGHMPQ